MSDIIESTQTVVARLRFTPILKRLDAHSKNWPPHPSSDALPTVDYVSANIAQFGYSADDLTFGRRNLFCDIVDRGDRARAIGGIREAIDTQHASVALLASALARDGPTLRRKSPKRMAVSNTDRPVFCGLYRLAPTVLDALR